MSPTLIKSVYKELSKHATKRLPLKAKRSLQRSIMQFYNKQLQQLIPVSLPLDKGLNRMGKNALPPTGN